MAIMAHPATRPQAHARPADCAENPRQSRSRSLAGGRGPKNQRWAEVRTQQCPRARKRSRRRHSPTSLSPLHARALAQGPRRRKRRRGGGGLLQERDAPGLRTFDARRGGAQPYRRPHAGLVDGAEACWRGSAGASMCETDREGGWGGMRKGGRGTIDERPGHRRGRGIARIKNTVTWIRVGGAHGLGLGGHVRRGWRVVEGKERRPEGLGAPVAKSHLLIHFHRQLLHVHAKEKKIHRKKKSSPLLPQLHAVVRA